MRILFITNYYPPYEVGGYEQLCRDVAAALAARGHEAQILTSDRGVSRGSHLDEPNVHRLLRIQPDFESSVHPMAQFFFTRRSDIGYNNRCLRKLAARFNPEIIFVWNVQNLPRSIVVEAEATPGAIVAYWLAGYSPAEPDEFWGYWASEPAASVPRWIKSWLRKVAVPMMRSEKNSLELNMRHVAVVSEYARRKGIAEGTLPTHTRVIYNGVEIDQFHGPSCREVDGQLKLLLAGRVSPDKGVHTVIEALGHVAQEQEARDICLYVAGTGPTEYLAQLQQLAEAKNISNMVSFSGWLTREDLAKLMAECHIFILPSIYPEAFSRVVLEAMVSGLAVIGTLEGGTGELLEHERTGLTFVAQDSHDLARQIKRLASDSDLRWRLATRGQQMVLERFTFDGMVNNIAQFLSDSLV